MNFMTVDKKYRPIPFWSWNEKMDKEETVRQIGVMDRAGIGGFFMHARGGLLTEYMGDEWFENVRAASEEATVRGMHPWAYDENGWPSGFGGGKICALGEEYRQKYLMVEPVTEENRAKERTVAVINGYRYYYEVNEFYVDTLDRKVIRRFIDEIYEEYYRREGNRFEGFFTDEPQIMRTGAYPWSFPFPESFRQKYGYDLLTCINELFFEEGDYKRTRRDFWKLVTELFSENYFKQIYDWCIEHGYGFTGHLLLEEDHMGQIRSSGASMPHYEYLSIPGMDWLGRPVRECLTAVQLGSAAAQLGKKQVLSETFALSGHNVSHGELKRIYEWQMVRGVNLLCTHLEGYSLRGIRKRDYPPAMYYQQPWWKHMNIFFDAMSRIGMILSEGETLADTLLISNLSSAWGAYNGLAKVSDAEGKKQVGAYNADMLSVMRRLEAKHVLYHIGDEILMERHGRVENGELVIGKMRYSRIILPKNDGFLPNTERLIDEFRRAGGLVTDVDSIAPNPITGENELTYTKRRYNGYDIHYFVNTTDKNISAVFSRGNKRLDIVTGELLPFFGSHKFEPYESLLLIDDGGERERMTGTRETEPLSLHGEWKVRSATYNSITLDRCDYYFDGELAEKDGYVLDILPRINEKRREVELKQVYRFKCDAVPEKIFLATETPWIFDISLNGSAVSSEPSGEFVDKSIKLLSISGLVRAGENELVLVSRIRQSDETYDHLSKSWAFETMKNSLSYDMEIEPVYIVGDFGARVTDVPDRFEERCYRIKTLPVITRSPETVDACALDLSGYPEFAGVLTLEREFEITDTAKHVYLAGYGMNCVKLTVNGRVVTSAMFPPYSTDISEWLKPGRNVFELEIVNNLRNLMGPHHIVDGESAWIGPASFFREANVFAQLPGRGEDCHDVLPGYNENISLVKFGLK